MDDKLAVELILTARKKAEFWQHEAERLHELADADAKEKCRLWPVVDRVAEILRRKE